MVTEHHFKSKGNAAIQMLTDFQTYCIARLDTNTHTHIRLTALLSGPTHKGKANLDFTGARDSEWQWNPLGHMQVCTSHQSDNHASTPLLSFLQARCPSYCPTNSVKALKAKT